jgi:hypothetical protein
MHMKAELRHVFNLKRAKVFIHTNDRIGVHAFIILK